MSAQGQPLNCEQAEELLPLLILGFQDEGSKPELMAHLIDCSSCQKKEEELRVTSGLLEAGLNIGSKAKLSSRKKETLFRRIESYDRLSSKRKNKKGSSWKIFLPAMAASVMVGFICLTLFEESLRGLVATSSAQLSGGSGEKMTMSGGLEGLSLEDSMRRYSEDRSIPSETRMKKDAVVILEESSSIEYEVEDVVMAMAMENEEVSEVVTELSEPVRGDYSLADNTKPYEEWGGGTGGFNYDGSSSQREYPLGAQGESGKKNADKGVKNEAREKQKNLIGFNDIPTSGIMKDFDKMSEVDRLTSKPWDDYLKEVGEEKSAFFKNKLAGLNGPSEYMLDTMDTGGALKRPSKRRRHSSTEKGNSQVSPRRPNAKLNKQEPLSTLRELDFRIKTPVAVTGVVARPYKNRSKESRDRLNDNRDGSEVSKKLERIVSHLKSVSKLKEKLSEGSIQEKNKKSKETKEMAQVKKLSSKQQVAKDSLKSTVKTITVTEVVDVEKGGEDVGFFMPEEKILPVNPFVMSSENAYSTFGLDVDTASYSLMRRSVRSGFLPVRSRVRMEEFINSFDYDYPYQNGRVFAVYADAAQAPFGQNLALLRIGIRGRTVGRDQRKRAHLVLVVDHSGSMAREDRLGLARYSMTQLIKNLNSEDMVTMVSLADQAHLIIENQNIGDGQALLKAIRSIEARGSTHLEDGLKLGYAMAKKYYLSGGINRVILFSDGVANVGSQDASQMLEDVQEARRQGVTLTCAGFGEGHYNDAFLEKLADGGDGQYKYIDSEEESDRVFVQGITGTLQNIAKDVKVQVVFNANTVRRYRQIGYENRQLKKEDFRNDRVDAAEVGSGQTGTALYEIELVNPKSLEDLGTVYLRYKNADTGKVEEIQHRILSSALSERSPKTHPHFYLAACAAEFAEILRESEFARDSRLDDVAKILSVVKRQLPLDKKVSELLHLLKSAKGLPRASK